MQFKSTVSVVYNTYNGYGEEVESYREYMKCAIVKLNKSIAQTITDRTRDYDMKFITSYKSFAPYKDLLSDDSLTFVYEDVEYKPLVVSRINDSTGKTKYVEIELKEKVK